MFLHLQVTGQFNFLFQALKCDRPWKVYIGISGVYKHDVELDSVGYLKVFQSFIVHNRKKRKVQQERQKLREKMNLKMVLPGDTKDMEQDAEMFSLSNIRSKKVTSPKGGKQKEYCWCTVD